MNEHQEHQYEYEETQMIIKLYPAIMLLPITDKRKIILSTLLSTEEQLQSSGLIEYKGELFKFHFRQQYIFQILNYPKNTFEYNMRWLRDNGYLNYRRGCFPGTNKQTTYFNVNTDLVFNMKNNKQ